MKITEQKIPWLVITAVLLFAIQAYPLTKEESYTIVSEAESLMKKLKLDRELSQFIPCDIFTPAVLDVNRARNLLDNRKYDDAAYYGTAAAVRLMTARIAAQARLARHQRLTIMSEQRALKKESVPDVTRGAVFQKKGDVFRSQLYDWQLFISSKYHIVYKLKPEAGGRLDRIIAVLQAYPDCSMKIVGHTENQDCGGCSRNKAEIAAKYFYEKKISPSRIEIIGLGNKEVIETHLGYRRASRVEFIISGI